MKKIPAPLDETNVTTDWIEEIFDNGNCTCNGSRIVGFVRDAPVYAIYYDNVVRWTVLDSFLPSDRINELIRRLDRYENPDEVVFSEKTVIGKTLTQRFFFRED